MEIVGLVKVAIQAFNKLMDKTPDYDQKKRADFLEKQRRFDEEVDATVADHAMIDKLGTELIYHIGQEIKLM